MGKKTTFYVTTPIYYATATPHLGTLYSTVLADVAARWHKLMGQSVFFLTGTDEFGQKVAQAAEKVGKTPKVFVDGFIQGYKDLWKLYEIEYSRFLRTTDQYHIEAVQKWIVDLQKKGDIYKGAYEGWYCTPCETYLTEKDFEVGTKNPPCVTCQRETQWVSEECYFFKLSKYQHKLLDFYKNNPKLESFVYKRFHYKMDKLEYNIESEDISDISFSVKSFKNYCFQILFNNIPNSSFSNIFCSVSNFINASDNS